MREYKILSTTSTKGLVGLITEALDSPPGSGPKWELYGDVFLSHDGGMFNQAMTKEPERVYGGKYHHMLVEDMKEWEEGIAEEKYQRKLEREDPEFS